MADIGNKLKFTGEGYLDEKMGPFADLASLKSIKYRFVGLTVNVLSPVPMECWLIGGKTNFNWRVKQFTSIPTYSALTEYTETIFASFKNMIAVGTEATVIADETNGGKLTKYWVTANDGTTITWGKMGINGDDFVPKNCIDGSDVENS